MPEAVLKYNLPEEESEFRLALDGGRYYIVLRELERFIGDQIKYKSHDRPIKESFESIRDKLYELSNKYDANIDV